MDVKPQSARIFKEYDKHICSEEDENAFQKALNLTKEYENSDGYRIQKHFQALSRSHRVVDENYDYLIRLLEEVEEGDTQLPDRETTQAKASEFLRCLSNYVGSVKNREYQTTEVILPRLDEVCDKEPSVSEKYKEHVTESGVELHGYFFSCLRNHIVHEGLPRLITYIGSEAEAPTFALDKQEILESDHWTQEAKGYADAFEESIVLTDALQDYQESLERLYQWLVEYVNERFEDRHQVQMEKGKHAKAAQDAFFDQVGLDMMVIEWE